MKNLIKAELYQLKKNKTIKIFFLGIMLLALFVPLSEVFMPSDPNIKTAGVLYVEIMGSLSIFAVLYGMIFTAGVCGEGFKDKTLNYNIMSGHKRIEIFFSRLIISTIGAVFSVIIILLTPLVTCTIFMPFGTEIAFADILRRVLLCVFPVIRIVTEMAFFTYLIKNEFLAMFVAFGIFEGTTLLSEFFPQAVTKSKYFLGNCNIMHLLSVESYSKYMMASTQQFTIYQMEVSQETILWTIVVSLSFAAIFAFLGYTFFKTDDIN